jgi:hypothetical protein
LIEAAWAINEGVEEITAVNIEILRRQNAIDRRMNRWEAEGAPIRNASTDIPINTREVSA